MAEEQKPNAPAIGIDLDGTIDESPDFFRLLTAVWPGRVYVITFRLDYEQAKKDVAKFGVRYDELVLVDGFEQKAAVIVKHDIKVFFDDMDEVLMHVPEGVSVFKVRNGGNFDFDARKWLYDRKTGREV